MDVQPLASNLVSIAEMARRTGLSAHTLRYYERAGLIRPVSRNASGHRRYGAQDAAWIAFLHRLRETGMPIRQMRAFAQLRGQGDATLGEREELLAAHRQAVEMRITTLQECRAALGDKIAHYRELQAAMTRSTPTQHGALDEQPPQQHDQPDTR